MFLTLPIPNLFRIDENMITIEVLKHSAMTQIFFGVPVTL